MYYMKENHPVHCVQWVNDKIGIAEQFTLFTGTLFVDTFEYGLGICTK